jgi:hypothetical protein
VYEDSSRRLKLRAIDSLTATTIAPGVGEIWGSRFFGGWSWDGRQVTYSHSVSWPGRLQVTLYVANVDGSEPAYRVLDYSGCSPTWLPNSHWLSADVPYVGTRVYNSRTGERFTLPRSADDAVLFFGQWRVVP